FPGDEAAMKLLYLVLNNAAEQWKRAPREWVEARHSSPSSLASGSSTDETGPPHRIPDSPQRRRKYPQEPPSKTYSPAPGTA
ncbi:hypothetical protein, partial [Sinorhizobium medicae]|uniref:hypothetical protein n=1 Tax=Sinorhizobium medicae TaxID=110321 RepID=UPI001AECC991